MSMVGVAAVRMLADRTGLTQAISAILARPGIRPIHDRGRVLVDMACAIAAGGVDIVDIEALRAQAEVFGPVASDTTALRALAALPAQPARRTTAYALLAGLSHSWSTYTSTEPLHPRQPQTMNRRQTVTTEPGQA
ncbi:hypothetical protein AB0F68_07375 [Micromonospora sp. NPDC023966]|uniref:hypothetical protein n=1 Tax=Micromonospora sp. NPDC023966 TaxID=3154699 RepID=UPI0033EEB93F